MQRRFPGTLALSRSRSELERALAAGREILACYEEAAIRDEHLLSHVVDNTEKPIDEGKLYPLPRGAIDRGSGASYYYHAHLNGEHGHFHTFCGAPGIPEGIRPARRPLIDIRRKDDEEHTHVVAISLDEHGLPIRLFTLNRWVTGGSFYAAPDVCRMLDLWSLDQAAPALPLVQRWLSAMMRLFRDDIEALLEERDEVLSSYEREHRCAVVLEAEDLEILSSIDIDLDAKLDAVRAALADRPRQEELR